ncbi:MAG: peptidylprolyl isomerase [Phycisphaerales bacterium]|nr:peptidylprolyl isomerase [Phycisphaerales bacterium]
MNRKAILVSAMVIAGALPIAALAQKDGDAIAIVNGKSLSRARVVDLLMESHGIEAMQQLILLDLAKQESAKRGFKVQPSDVTSEFNRSLDKIAAAAGGEVIDEAAKRLALDTLLAQKGLSLAEFMVGMERNAHLRKVVESEIKISDDLLREEFSRTYGEKVQVRHIQIPAAEPRELTDVIEQLNQKREFADVARQLSRNPDTAAGGGELPAFAFDDSTIPAVLREAAFSMQPGEVSAPIRVDNWFQILKLEKRIAPENAKFEDVRPQVEQRFRDRVVPQEMSRLATELFKKAEVRVIEPKLREKFEELRKKSAASESP